MKKFFFGSMIALAALSFTPTPAHALLLWGYTNTQAQQNQFRYVFAANGPNGCKTLSRNQNSSFILRDQIDYLSAFAFKINAMSGMNCILNDSSPTSISTVNAVAVTPRHIIVAIHWGIWGGQNTFGFIGTDNQLYIAKTIPGVIALTNAAGTATDIGLVELDRDLPPRVMPLHVLDPTALAGQLAGDTPTYVSGNLHTALNYDAWQQHGNPDIKGIGTNISKFYLMSPSSVVFKHEISQSFGGQASIVRPANPQSTNWSDYWYWRNNYYLPVPALGTAFPSDQDSSSPTFIKGRDARGATRLFFAGNHIYLEYDNYLGNVIQDLRAKIALYNQQHGKSYAINAYPIKSFGKIKNVKDKDADSNIQQKSIAR